LKRHFAERALYRTKLPTPEEFVAYLRGEIEKWEKVVKASGMKLD